jgi:hypothetical protein
MWAHDPDAAAAGIGVPILGIAVNGGIPMKPARVGQFAVASDATVRWVSGHHDIPAHQPGLVVDMSIGRATEVLS